MLLFANIIVSMPGSMAPVDQRSQFPLFQHPSQALYHDPTNPPPVHDSMSASLEGDRYVPTLMPPGWRPSESDIMSVANDDISLHSQSYSAQSTPMELQLYDSEVPDPLAILAFLDEAGPSFGLNQTTAEPCIGDCSEDGSRVALQLPPSPPEVPLLPTNSPAQPPTPNFDITQLFYPSVPLPTPNHNPQIF